MLLIAVFMTPKLLVYGCSLTLARVQLCFRPSIVCSSFLKNFQELQEVDEWIWCHLCFCQAFNKQIANWAVKEQRFGGPHFKPDRMTWSLGRNSHKKHHALNTRRSGVLHLGQKARKPSLQGQFFCTLATLVGKIHWLRYLPFGKSMFGTLGFRPILAMIRIKPSLAWVLYRAGYGFKDANQDVGRPHWGVFTVSVKGRGYIDQGAPSGLWLFPCYYGHQQCW